MVITSSVRAVVQAEVRTYKEDDWAEDAVKIVEEKKNEAPGMYIYGASKVLAEKGGPLIPPTTVGLSAGVVEVLMMSLSGLGFLCEAQERDLLGYRCDTLRLGYWGASFVAI